MPEYPDRPLQTIPFVGQIENVDRLQHLNELNGGISKNSHIDNEAKYLLATVAAASAVRQQLPYYSTRQDRLAPHESIKHAMKHSMSCSDNFGMSWHGNRERGATYELFAASRCDLVPDSLGSSGMATNPLQNGPTRDFACSRPNSAHFPADTYGAERTGNYSMNITPTTQPGGHKHQSLIKTSIWNCPTASFASQTLLAPPSLSPRSDNSGLGGVESHSPLFLHPHANLSGSVESFGSLSGLQVPSGLASSPWSVNSGTLSIWKTDPETAEKNGTGWGKTGK